MAVPSPARPPLRRQAWWGWVRLFRPIAMLTGTGVVVAYGFILTDGSPVWHEVLRLALAMAAVLAAASAFNDVRDLAHDRDAHLWRPLPAGLLRPIQAERVAYGLALMALALGGSLGWRSVLLVLAGIALTIAYSVRLRNTPLSWLPLALAFVIIPVWVADALDAFANLLWWAVPVGLSGGLAMHLLLKLPDYERDDTETGHNVLHWLTIDYAVPASWGATGAYIAAAVGSANVEEFRVAWMAGPAAALLVLTLVMIGVLFGRVTERRLVIQRWLLSAGIVALAIGWLGSIAP